MVLQAPGSVAPFYACIALQIVNVVWDVMRKQPCTWMPMIQGAAVNDASALSIVAVPAQLAATDAN